MTERLHFHFSLSCIEEGNGNPLQCSCLENPRDGGAWWAAVYGVTQSQTRLKWLSSSSSTVLDDKEMTPLPFGALLAFLWSINQIMTVRNRKAVGVLNNTVENLEINYLTFIHLVPLRNSLYILSWGPLFQLERLDKTICGTVIRHFWYKSRRKEVRSAAIPLRRCPELF